MSFEAFEHYLSDDSRRGPAPDGAFSGAAGGAPCGDLVRVSLARRATVAWSRRRFDAEGCAAATAAGAAVAERPRARACWTRRAIGAGRDLRGARRALAAGPPRRRAGRRRASPRARRRGLVGRAPGGPAGERRARAGGDERRGRLRRRRAARARARRRGGRGDAEAVGRPAHRRRAELLLAGGGGRRPSAGPRARAAPPDAGPRGRVSRHRRRRVRARLRGGPDAEPLRDLQRRGADRRDARARAAGSGRRRSRPATTRASSTTAQGPLLAAPADARQGPDLHALGAAAGDARRGCASRSPT